MTLLGVLVSINLMKSAAAAGQADAGKAFDIVPLGGIAFFAIVFAHAVDCSQLLANRALQDAHSSPSIGVDACRSGARPPIGAHPRRGG